ncbi:MAG: collagen binding domain-containing protein [Eggerthellaceae bacterium]
MTYLIVETASPDGYVAESEPPRSDASYESQTVAIVEEGITIEEQPCHLVATKKDKASKEPIEGVVLDVYRTERSSAVEEDAPFLSASTDSEGKTAFSKLPRDATYRIVEAESRIDLGYPTQHAEAALYLPDGRWYSDFAAYEEETRLRRTRRIRNKSRRKTNRTNRTKRLRPTAQSKEAWLLRTISPRCPSSKSTGTHTKT